MTVDPRSYTVVDVFTDVPLEGNPVAVFEDGSGLDDTVMQRVARELNLSETVFVLPSSNGSADARVRIFTPFVELPFAGHPVLGTAFVLGGRVAGPSVALETRAGLVPVAVTRSGGSEVVYGEMEQPLPVLEPFDQESELLAALGLSASELPIEGYRNGPMFIYVALPDEMAVASLSPDLRALARLEGSFGVSCFAGAGQRWKTRMFAPRLGVGEDPATGSAAGPLAYHLARHGRIDWGVSIDIHQGAEIGRPSLLRARVEGTPERLERITVAGSAVIVARGEYRVG